MRLSWPPEALYLASSNLHLPSDDINTAINYQMAFAPKA